MELNNNIDDLLVPKSKEIIIKELSNLSQRKRNKRLFDASYNGYLDIVKLLIENGADINAKNEYDYNSLMLASKNGFIDVVSLLINNGADINVENEYGSTALTYAFKYNNKYIIELLKKHKAKLFI
jgi:ankyrin repeat protein